MPLTGRLAMPPVEFDHAFAGNQVNHVMPPGMQSMEIRSDPLTDGFTGRKPQCDVWLPRTGDPGVSAQRRADLATIERATAMGGRRATAT